MGFDGLYGDLYEDDILDENNEDENEDDIPDIPDGNNGYSQDRPWFSKSQIRKVKDLQPGMIVISYCAADGGAVYYRIDGEVRSESGHACVKASKMRGGKVIFTSDLYMGDHNIVPYESGFWNSTNCLLRTRSRKTKFIRLPKDLSKPIAV